MGRSVRYDELWRWVGYKNCTRIIRLPFPTVYRPKSGLSGRNAGAGLPIGSREEEILEERTQRGCGATLSLSTPRHGPTADATRVRGYPCFKMTGVGVKRQRTGGHPPATAPFWHRAITPISFPTCLRNCNRYVEVERARFMSSRMDSIPASNCLAPPCDGCRT